MQSRTSRIPSPEDHPQSDRDTLGSTEPISRLADDIESARRQLLAAVDVLDRETVVAPLGDGRWSPLGYLEHLVRAEEATLWRMFKAVDDARVGGEVLRSPTPEAQIEEIVDRTWRTREEAPPMAIPALGGSPAYWMERMRRAHGIVSAFVNFVEEPELDVISYSHPISGPFTMRQGLQFIRFHMDRHRNHIEEAG